MAHCDSRAPMHFQKSAWVDTTTMKKLAEESAQNEKDRHNGLECVLISENLSTRVTDEAKEIFHRGNILCFCAPQTEESNQPIDDGHCRSLRCSVGKLLDR